MIYYWKNREVHSNILINYKINIEILIYAGCPRTGVPQERNLLTLKKELFIRFC